MLDAEVGAQPPGVRDVLAALGPDGERDAVRVEGVDLGQGQRAVQAAGEDHADPQVGVDTAGDGVGEGRPDGRRGLVDVDDRRPGLAEPVEVEIGVQVGVGVGIGPAAVTGRHLVDPGTQAHQRLDLRGDVEPSVAARPVERLDPDGSRARKTRRVAVSTIASANSPRSRRRPSSPQASTASRATSVSPRVRVVRARPAAPRG